MTMTILQKGTCEAIWRAYEERGAELADLHLPHDPAHRHRFIEDFVSMCRTVDLARIALPEVENFGRLRGGYGERWGKGYLPPAPPSIDLMAPDASMSAPD